MVPPQPAPTANHPPSCTAPVSSSSMNSSGNLPDPFASLGLNSGDWLNQMLGVGASLQGVLPPDALTQVATTQALRSAKQETLVKLPSKAPPLQITDTALGTSAAGRVRRPSARAAAAASDDEEEDTPFADFVPTAVEGSKEAMAGSGEHGARTTGVRRKAPDVDWRSVSDPEERKRLRRMAKNRRTAAASRERKKAALDNLSSENEGLKQQLGILQQQLAHERVARTAAEAEVARLRGLMKQPA